ncbi:MAG TPA: SNF2-related protein, partial [Polyangia bacterium]
MSPPAVTPFGPTDTNALPRAVPDQVEPRPRLRLFTETMAVNDGDAFDPTFEDRVLPALSLVFAYGSELVRANDKRNVIGNVVRDRAREAEARRLLESFGPLDLACLEEVTPRLGTRADYVLRTDADQHVLCSFTAYAVPQLRAHGWVVDIAEDYPWQTIDADPVLYADVQPEESSGCGDWFNLELGIIVDGRRINLLPLLLDLVARLSPSGRLGAMAGARGFAVPAGDGRFVTIPAARMQVLLKVIDDLHGKGAGKDQVRFASVAAHALAEMEAALGTRSDGRPTVTWSGVTAIKDRGQALLAGPAAAPVETPAGLRADLRPYQREGLAWLQHLRELGAGGVLADDMGLGKTLQAIAHIATEKAQGRLARPALVVTLTSLVGNWRRELARFAPHLTVVVLHGPQRHRLWPKLAHADVVITTYPALVRDGERWEGQKLHLALLDEAQAIKNPRSQAHQAVIALDAEHRVCLSGTPVENSLSELWSLFEFVNPGLLGDAEWFAHRYTRPIEREGRSEPLVQLRAQVAPFILRRMKEEVAKELPPKTEIVRPVELRGAQRDLYEGLRLAGHAEVRRAIADKGVAASTITILDALMKLRQVCCDPRLLPPALADGVTESAKHQL